MSLTNNTKSLIPPRESNIELFRILSMFLIIAHHYVVNSGLTASTGPIYSDLANWRSIFLLLFGAWGKTGINCFVLITGYFMCKSNITLKKFSKLILEMYFYRFIIYFLLLIANYETISLTRIVKLILPFTSISSNFTGCYLLFFLIIPFLNVLIHNMTHKQHLLLIAFLVSVYTLFASVPIFSISFNYITWFSILYILSSYVRLYPNKWLESPKVWGIVFLISSIIASASVVVGAIVPNLLGVTLKPYMFVADSNKIFALAVGFSSFMFFKNLTIKPNKFINTIASTTFGVFLIHANSAAMRTWLWGDVAKCVEKYSINLLPLYAITVVVAIFAVCSIIDYLRIRFIERPFYLHIWNKIEAKISRKFPN